MAATSDSGGGSTPPDGRRDTGPGVATRAPAGAAPVALDALLARLRPTYAVERELPPGGMSRVFLARDTALDRMVVVKVLPTHLATPAAVDRFRREILLVAGLHHPNVVGIISAGDVDGVPYYVMPYLEGASLAGRMAALGPNGRLPVGEVTAVLRDVARALAYAHGRGIVHRDVKPHNVLLVGGAALVTDFGVAKAVRDAVHGGSGERSAAPWSQPSITGTGLSVGTPLYMAPEQAAGDPAVDARADVYALGATAYEMLAGAAPFAELPPHELLRAKLTRQPPALRERRPDVPPALAALVHECLAVNPAERPSSAAAVVERLNVAVSGEGTATAGGVRLAPPARQRRTRLAAAAASAAVVALAAAALVATRGRARPDARPNGAPAAAPPAAAAPLAVAIVPLVPLSEDSSDAHLAEGLTAHAAAALARLPNVRVVSPSYVQGLLRDGTPPGEAARRLGATLVVEGTLERAAGRLRATARLVEAGTGVMRWAGTFDRGTRELFALQDDVVVGLARSIRPDAPAAPAPAGGSPAEPPQAAYELVLRARHQLRSRRPEALREAIAALERATRLAPAYAPAYGTLAEAYTLLPLYAQTSVPDALARAAAAAERAVVLGDSSAEAHAAYARVQDALWHWDDAERGYRKALALDARDAGTWQAYGEHLLVRGDAAGALRALDRAVRLDSTSAVARASLAVALAAAGRAPAALAAADSAVRLAPDAPVTWLLLGAVQILAGRTGDAAASLDAGLARAPRSPLGLGLAGWAAARLGDAAGARAAGRRVDALGGAPGQPLALVHLRLGLRDTAGALGALERAVDLHDPMLATEPLWSSLFDEVRGSARFRAALARLGLEAAAAR